MKKLKRFNQYQLVVSNLMALAITIGFVLVNDLQPQPNLNLLPTLVTYASSTSLVGLPVIVVILFGIDQLSVDRLSIWYSIPFVLTWGITLVMTTVRIDWNLFVNQSLSILWLFGWLSGVLQLLTRQSGHSNRH